MPNVHVHEDTHFNEQDINPNYVPRLMVVHSTSLLTSADLLSSVDFLFLLALFLVQARGEIKVYSTYIRGIAPSRGCAGVAAQRGQSRVPDVKEPSTG